MAGLNEKYLGFQVGEEFYGIRIDKISQVVRYEKINAIHETSSFIKGVINLRGKIIPIIDMRLKFGMKEKDYSDRTIFIIVEIENIEHHQVLVGMVVDKISDVIELNEEMIEKAPEMGLKKRQSYLNGIAQVGNRMMMILNIDKVLNTDEITDIKALKTEEKVLSAPKQ